MRRVEKEHNTEEREREREESEIYGNQGIADEVENEMEKHVIRGEKLTGKSIE